MDRGSSSTRPRECMGFEPEVRKGGSHEYSAAIRSLAGEMQVLPRDLLYDSRRDEYLCFSSRTPPVHYLKLSQPVEQLPMMLPLSIPGMVISPLGLERLDVEREKGFAEDANKVLQEVQ